MEGYNEYIANRKDLSFYKGKAILNKAHEFYDKCNLPWNFGLAIGFTFKIWQEREGGLLMIDWISPTNLTWSDNTMILNAPAADTNIELGRYYYEIEFLIDGGYSVLVAFGKADFI